MDGLDAEIQENVILNENYYRAIYTSMSYAAISIPFLFISITNGFPELKSLWDIG